VLILGISGSLRAASYNTALLRTAHGLLPPAARIVLYDGLAAVPPYSEDADRGDGPAAVAELRARIATADALLIATPEYNGSIPGQLKNALDWASRPFPDSVLRGKRAAVVGASTGIFGAVWAQAELRKALARAGANVLDAEVPVASAEDVFDARLRLTDPGVTATLATVLAELASPAVEARHESVRADPRAA
jgi:chromate reductase, NAD(P)H dehydrogenase (quinone)